MQTGQEMAGASQNQRGDIFYSPHPPNPGPEGLDMSRGFPGRMVTGQFEPCITTFEVVVMYLRGQSIKLSLVLRYSRMINFIHRDIHLYFRPITQRWPT